MFYRRLAAATLLSVLAAAANARTQQPGGSPAPVSFNKDIAPILAARCASCHQPGGVGPFSLLTYRDARQRGTLIAQVVTRRLMPPWKPLAPRGTFQDDRSLTPAEIALFEQWVAEGAIEGPATGAEPPAVSAALPTAEEFWALGRPDLVVRMEQPYDLAASGSDVFRSFVIPIPAASARWVRAIEFHPGNPRVVHHANIGVDQTGASRRRDQRDAGPGYAGGLLPDAAYPAGFLLGWAPGETPRPSPDGTAWRLMPGSDLVLGIHLQPTGKPETVQASVGIFFTDEAPVRTPLGLRLGSKAIDIPAGDSDYIVSDRYVLPVDVELVALRPHAHLLARRIEARVELPDGTGRSLLTIPDWDFRWQEVYRYTQPAMLPRGTALTIRYSYDNSAANPRNPNSPPRRITWGQSSKNEMGDLWVQVIPRTAADAAILSRDISARMTAADIALLTTLVDATPDDVSLHEELAGLDLRIGQVDEAIRHLREAVRLEPQSALARYNLGLALLTKRQLPDAATEFRHAIGIDPGFGEAYNNLGNILYQLGQIDDAIGAFERAVQERPENAEAHSNLALTLMARKRWEEAADSYQRALALKPELPAALTGLGWIRATAADARVRDVNEAIRLAERAAALTQRRDALALDALAAAYAAASRFDDATATAAQAAALADESGSVALARDIRLRREQYARRLAYISPQ